MNLVSIDCGIQFIYCIKYIDVDLMNLSANVTSFIGNFTSDVDDLMNKTIKLIEEIDDIILNLSDIHQEINQVGVNIFSLYHFYFFFR